LLFEAVWIDMKEQKETKEENPAVSTLASLPKPKAQSNEQQ
jgi:hypothetical protein